MLYEKKIYKKNIKSIDIRMGLAYPNIYKTAMSSLERQDALPIGQEKAPLGGAVTR